MTDLVLFNDGNPTGRPSMEDMRQALAYQGRRFEETLASLQLSMDTRGWTKVGGLDKASGLNLSSIQTVHDELQSHVAGGSILKRLAEVRGAYAYGDGFGFNGIPKAKLKNNFQNDNNVEKVFSPSAMIEVNRAHATAGNQLFLVHKRTFEIIRVPFEQVQPPVLDAVDTERWLYVKRSYVRKTLANPTGVKHERYYVTDTCPKEHANETRIEEGNGVSVAVDPDYIALNWSVNRQVGWAFGIPDLLAALPWAERYAGYLVTQGKFAEALAAIAWQYTAKNQDQAKRLAATVSQRTVAGSRVDTQGVEAKQMSGGSDVSFENGSPLAAQAAAGAEVPVGALTGKGVSDAGGNLDQDFVRVIMARRQSAIAFFKRLGRVLGAPKLEVVFPDLAQETPFRTAQMIVAAWDTGMFEGEELRRPLASALRVPLEEGSTVPDGLLLPNNEKTNAKAAEQQKKLKDAKGDGDDQGGGMNGQGDDKLGVGKLSDGDNTARDKKEN